MQFYQQSDGVMLQPPVFANDVPSTIEGDPNRVRGVGLLGAVMGLLVMVFVQRVVLALLICFSIQVSSSSLLSY